MAYTKKCESCGSDRCAVCMECSRPYCEQCGPIKNRICDTCCPWPIPKPQEGPTEEISIDLDEETWKKLDKMRWLLSLRAGRDVTMDALVEDILKRYMDQIEEEEKDE